MNRRLPTISEEAELPTSLTLVSPEGDSYLVSVDPLPEKDVYSVAVTDPHGAVNAEGWYDEVATQKALKWWSDLIAKGGEMLRSLFEAEEPDWE